ncbi:MULTISPECIES: sporulation inhibitor of replication protein SirA [Bacillaceae]|uniref:Sporulation inhibitor of replication protein SirA n=1 Tax=Evansella alkalicola TaxID=745819 RepID=A0ABS6JVN6_9BACI|nr:MULTISPECIES: sporulation inhibitor of replication protein SirA [Bacillaceae]MBU9722642.1 sporulation inhibitor of replication protein SirA [Bacillus alkalicola]
MREYEIYVIREEIANTYYGLETKLYQLFKENRAAQGNLKEITDKQIQFIIGAINYDQLQVYLNKELEHKEAYSFTNNKHYIIMDEENSQAGLYIHEDYITLYSEGGYDAEACFFEALRRFHPYFLAMEFSQGRYGWLKPLKSLDVVQHS